MIQSDNLSKRYQRKVLSLNFKFSDFKSSKIEYWLREKVKINALKQKQISKKLKMISKRVYFHYYYLNKQSSKHREMKKHDKW
jgi:hypothetical protein